MHNTCFNCNGSDLSTLYAAPAFDSSPTQSTVVFDISRCSACQLVNTTEASQEQVSTAYHTEYYGSPSSKFTSSIEFVLSLSTLARAKGMIRLWRKGRPISAQPSVLDIGCGRGHLLSAFKTCGASVLGLEREEFPDNGAANQFIEVGAIGDPQYHDRKFDIIVIWHVLEHMENHEQLLDEVTKHLSDKGILVIAVPNFGSLQQRLFSKYWFHLDLPRHLVHFESEWLERRLLDRSYKIERKSYIDLLQNTFGFIQSTMNTITAHSQNSYYRILKHSQKRSTGSFIAMFGWSVFSIAVLPFALIDGALGAALGRGATVQIVARLETEK